MARPTAGDVVLHPSPALISSSRSTTSSAPTCRTAPGRGASLPSSSYFFVGKHHVLRSKMPTGPGDVVPHCPPALVSSSRSTTSSTPKCRAAPGAWCLTALQPLFLRREAPRPAPHFPDRAGGVVPHPSPALIPSSAGTTSGGSSTRPASHAAGYCKISIILDKCVLKGNFFYGIISIRRYSI